MTDQKYAMGSGDPRRGICTLLCILILLAGVTVLVLWLVYRPHKPQFTVTGAAVTGLNTTPPFISTNIQFTVVARNSNKRLAIYYDRLSAFVMYRNQQITPPVPLPPLYQEEKTSVGFSPVLGGVVPASAEVANGLEADETYGVLGVRLVIVGRLRWKTGLVKTGHYGVYVKCDVVMGVKKGQLGQAPLLKPSECGVDI